jgi:hypothetical protein
MNDRSRKDLKKYRPGCIRKKSRLSVVETYHISGHRFIPETLRKRHAAVSTCMLARCVAIDTVECSWAWPSMLLSEVRASIMTGLLLHTSELKIKCLNTRTRDAGLDSRPTVSNILVDKQRPGMSDEVMSLNKPKCLILMKELSVSGRTAAWCKPLVTCDATVER